MGFDPESRKGFALDSDLTVIHVAPEGPADVLGVRLGWHVIAVDGTPVSCPPAFPEALQTSPRGSDTLIQFCFPSLGSQAFADRGDAGAMHLELPPVATAESGVVPDYVRLHKEHRKIFHSGINDSDVATSEEWMTEEQEEGEHVKTLKGRGKGFAPPGCGTDDDIPVPPIASSDSDPVVPLSPTHKKIFHSPSATVAPTSVVPLLLSAEALLCVQSQNSESADNTSSSDTASVPSSLGKRPPERPHRGEPLVKCCSVPSNVDSNSPPFRLKCAHPWVVEVLQNIAQTATHHQWIYGGSATRIRSATM